MVGSEPIPQVIVDLYSGENALNSTYFGKQVRNLRDTLVLSDLLNCNAVSMEYGGWDSHKSQKNGVEPKFNDLFGTGRGLDSLHQSIPDSVADKLVFVVAGEFGRQLKANGDNGCDHGKGNSMLVIGREVNGVEADKTSSVYGDMFPVAELNRLNESSPDIAGLTDAEWCLMKCCYTG